jgi:acyl dehydratase
MSLAIDLAAALETLPGRGAPLERSAEVPVSEHAIRTWCAAIGERNLLYLDREAARRAGYPAVVAPPAMLQTWTMPIAERPAAPTLHARVRAAARDCGLGAVVATDYEQEYLRPVHPGQLLREQSWIEAVSPPKSTALGRGQFVTIAFEICDRAGTPVGRMRARTLYFDPGLDPGPAAPRPAAAGDEPGDMAPLQVPLTRTLIVAASLASNDHEAVHHDHEIARAQGLDDIIASIVTTAGLVLRYTGLVAGDSPCRSLALRLARPAFPGDVVVFQGRTTATADGTRFGVRGDHARGRHVTAEVSYGHGP